MPVTTAKTATPVTLSVLVFARASGNMRFGAPQSYVQVAEDSWLAIAETVRVESGPAGMPNDDTKVVSEHLVQAMPFPAASVCWGEEFSSVRALMQKFSPLVTGLPVEARENRMWVPHFPVPPTDAAHWHGMTVDGVVGGTRVPFNWAGYYACLFTGIRCSSRVKIQVFDNNTLSRFVWATPLSTFEDIAQFSGTLALTSADNVPRFAMTGDLQVVSTTRGAEWVFPNYYPLKHWNPRQVPDALNMQRIPRINGFMQDQLHLGNPTWGTIRFWTACGPDIAVTAFRRQPGIKFS